MARPRIEGPTPQEGDVFALYHKGKPEGRRIKIETVGARDVEARTVGGRDATTCISLAALRPTANGWHLVERDGRPVLRIGALPDGTRFVELGPQKAHITETAAQGMAPRGQR